MKHSPRHPFPAALLQSVRTLIAAALAFLGREEAARFLRRAQKKMTEAETAVRRWLAEQALALELPAKLPESREPPPNRQRIPRKRQRGFSVMPPGLTSLSGEYLRAPKFEMIRDWQDQRAASLRRRAERIDAVTTNPDAYVLRLARLIKRGDPLCAALRFLSAGIRLPKDEIRKYLPAPQPVPIDDSS